MVNDPKTVEIIEKWYKKIGFSPRYDEEFYCALDNIKVDVSISVEKYNLQESDGKKNFLYFLYFCEELSHEYDEKGIGEDILLDTLSDMPRWLDTWSDLKGEMYFGEIGWFICHFSMKLFKIGRLQFCMSESSRDIPQKGISKGDNVVDIHIPAAGPLIKEDCQKSLDMARVFFAKFYPEFNYSFFMCSSWLLDETLGKILDKNSNILQFQKFFDIVDKHESDSIFGYVLRWKATRNEIADIMPKNSFAKKVKELALSGEKFYEGTGVIEK